MSAMPPDFADPRWFAVDLDVPERAFRFLPIDEDVLERSVFIDNRIAAPLNVARPVPVEALSALPLPAAPPAYLFHTAFCGSSLLARALHLPGHGVALREPLLLRRLADAQVTGRVIHDLMEPAWRLLARPWTPGGRVLVKPTNMALDLAGGLLERAPSARAVVLYSGLEDFLISNLKKSPETQAKIPGLALRLARAAGLDMRLGIAGEPAFDLITAVVVMWAAEIEILGHLLATPLAARVRVLTMDRLLADLPATTAACAAWYGFDWPATALAARVAVVGAEHAKEPGMAYGPAQRAAEAERVRARHGEAVRAALAWAERDVLPRLRSPTLLEGPGRHLL